MFPSSQIFRDFFFTHFWGEEMVPSCDLLTNPTLRVILLCFLREISDQQLFLYRILRIESQPCRGMGCGVSVVLPALDMSDFSTSKFSRSWEPESPNNQGIFQQKNPDKIPTLNQQLFMIRKFGSASRYASEISGSPSRFPRASGRLMRRGHLDTPAGDGSS